MYHGTTTVSWVANAAGLMDSTMWVALKDKLSSVKSESNTKLFVTEIVWQPI